MKRAIILLVAAVLTTLPLTACNNAKAPGASASPSPSTKASASPQANASASPGIKASPSASSAATASASPGVNVGALTAAELKKMAKDAGYTVEDTYDALNAKDVLDGFSAQIYSSATDKKEKISFLEFRSNEEAQENVAVFENTKNYKVLRERNVLAYCSVDAGEEETRAIQAILDGKPVPPSQVKQ